MVVRFLSKNQIITSLLSAIVLGLGLFYSFYTNSSGRELALFQLNLSITIDDTFNLLFVIMILTVLCGIAQLFIFNLPVNRNKMLGKISFLPVFILAFLFVLTVNLASVQITIIGTLFFSLPYVIIASIGDTKNGIKTAFNCGLLIGLAGFFNIILLLLLPIIFIGLLHQRKFYWREWTAPIIGAALPLLFLVVIDPTSFRVFKELFKPTLLLEVIFEGHQFIPLVAVGVLCLISVPALLKRLQLSTVSERKNVYLLMWLAIIGAISGISTGSLFIIAFFLLPFISFLITNFLLNLKRKWLADLLLTVFIAAIVYNQLKEYWQI